MPDVKMKNQVRQIAMYGKGGCGKSTVSANIALALQTMGWKVMQVGCSPKVDSTCFLLGGEIQTKNILEYFRDQGIDENSIYEVILKGVEDVWCVEAGGPAPAEGCAGRGTAVALELLAKYNVFHNLGVNFVIYDVIADVVCGGFAQPMRAGYAHEIYIVANGELMALYSSNNICIAVQELAKAGADVGIAGIIDNMRGVTKERELIEEFGERLNVKIIGHVPRSDLVQKAEALGGTVVEKFPESPQSEAYREVAKAIVGNTTIGIPTPIELQEIMDLLRKYQALD